MRILSVLLTAMLSAPPAASSGWLVGSDQAKDASEAAIFAVRPGERIDLASIGVLENYAPILRLSPSGKTLFILRQTVPNHSQGTGEILALDLKTRALRTIAAGADADPFLAISDTAAVYLETLETRPQTDDFDHVALSVVLSEDGERRELARLDGIYGASLAGISESGIVLYVVGLKEAAFYLLPFDEDAVRGTRVQSDKAAPESCIFRIAQAPTGPFAREFSVRGDRLFFSALSPDENVHSLYELQLPAPSEVSPDRRVTRQAVPAGTSGVHSPKAILSGDGSRLIYASFGNDVGSGGSRLLMMDWNGTKDVQDSRREARPFLSSKGTLTPVALDARNNVLVVRRSFGGTDELLWTDGEGRGGMRRISVRGFCETAGFTEEVSP